ncbi:hypothetical protein [Anaerocolumna xylanovorans]|uniref:Uncharacterized protein n=1 Tax=Anaerocolumna xylanovorans DSM 12503 TaxID=1121345 RepID=A0A1M7YE48_9FIRM|nr:hypothetical protein [Anaerocolumna xylanovorans]SHO50912.1 hypothetical protein SAMN02745217_02967 [Anaerocolumna xylanovorans DSM 12503]
MTEEMHNLNTDFKELFAENKLNELIKLLDKTSPDTLFTITNFNYNIVRGYLDSAQFELLKQYIHFVAFTSFLCEYAGTRQILEEPDFNSMLQSFHHILEYIQQNK